MEDKQPTKAQPSQISSAHSAVSPAFQIGETVWSALSSDERGQVTSYAVYPGRAIIYRVAWASRLGAESQHYDFELSREPLFQHSTR